MKAPMQDLPVLSGAPRWLPLALGAPAIALVLFGLLVPLAVMTERSLHKPVPGRVAVEPGWTLQNYGRALLDPFYLEIVGRTVGLATLATALCLILGFPLAYFLWRAPARWKGLLTLAVLAPMLISIVVRTYGWMIILGDSGVLNAALLSLGIVAEPLTIMFTPAAVVTGFVHVELPFMVLSVLASLNRIDPNLCDAAKTLGATPARAVWWIVAPLAKPGILAGATLVFSLCMTSFVTPALMGGSGTRVLTTTIYDQFVTAFDWAFGGALATILLALSLGLVLLLNWVGAGGRLWGARP